MESERPNLDKVESKLKERGVLEIDTQLLEWWKPREELYALLRPAAILQWIAYTKELENKWADLRSESARLLADKLHFRAELRIAVEALEYAERVLITPASAGIARQQVSAALARLKADKGGAQRKDV
jgi:hypothetical protein